MQLQGISPIYFNPAVARTTYFPINDNAIDLGTTLLQFRTVFVRTGLESSGAIKVKPSNVESLQFDSTGIRTNLTAFTVYTNTADASDNSQISITAGGNAMDHTRGGYIRLSGNEHANAGSIFMRTGDAAAASIVLDCYGSAGTIAFKNQNSHIMWVTATGMQSQLAAGMIYTNTSDTSDNAEFSVCGGGGSSISRGARFTVFGNEHATNGGQAGFTGGGVSTGHVYLTTSNASAYIQLTLNGTKDWEFRATNKLIYTTDALIAAATSDGSDNKYLWLAGGGDVSITRGAFIELSGNERNNGSMALYLGNHASSKFTFLLAGASSTFEIYDASSTMLYFFNQSREFVFAGGNGVIRPNSADASDNRLVTICGGGSNAASRGTYIELAGNEHANGGAINIWGGAISTGNINSVIGHSSAKIQFFNASTAVMWDINNSGDINQNATNGNLLVFNKANTTINFAGTMGDSTKVVGTDAPADWVEVKIGGTTRYLPAYAA